MSCGTCSALRVGVDHGVRLGDCQAAGLMCGSNARWWPILLKKSAMVSRVEKYALEIEIFALSRGMRAQI